MTAPAITTVTLNPTIDEAVAIDRFVMGGQNRCRLDALDPGGKGINASRVIRRLGRQTIALGFTGGITGALLRTRLDEEGVMHAFDEVGELTRLNVMIFEDSTGRSTRLYLPGPPVPPEKLEALRVRLAHVQGGSLVVMGGSLPPGVPETIYAEFVAWLASRGVQSIVDASGRPLELALAARPLLVKPNREEAEELLGRALPDDEAVAAAAREIAAHGAVNVVISLGAEGAIGLGPEGAWKAVPPAVAARSAVGSGDSMVAGLAIALNEGSGLREGLRLGTATGAATAMTPGTHLCDPETVSALIERVSIAALDSLAGIS